MTINSSMQIDGLTYPLEYHDADSFADLPKDLCRQIYGVCFVGSQLVIGFGGHKDDWGLIGGTIEAGETFEQTLAREIAEESNMRVLAAAPIGFQIVVKPDGSKIYQLRSACLVEPIGPFVSDPGGLVTAIKLIDPSDYRQYFDWGKIGDRLIARALELKPKLKP